MNFLFTYNQTDITGIKRDMNSVLSQIGERVDALFDGAEDALLSSYLEKRSSNVFVIGKEIEDLGFFNSFYEPVKGGLFTKEKIVYFSKDLTKKKQSDLAAALKKHLGFAKTRCVFKLYGNIAKELSSFCKKALSVTTGINYFITEENSDIRLEIVLRIGYNAKALDVFLKKFLLKYKDSVYSTDDTTLAERLVDNLKIQSLKMSTAESMTGGNIAATIVKVPGASEVFFEGLTTYNTLSKEVRLGVSRKTIMNNTVVSKEVAYEMVRSLINKNSSVGISITGYAPSVSPNPDDGLCFIGVAVEERTLVSRFIFLGDRTAVIEQATNTAIFLLLKLLTDRFYRGS